MDIIKATKNYQDWIGQRIPLIPADLDRKHAHMAEDPFQFFRATFYRWAQTWFWSPRTAARPETRTGS